MEHDFYKLEIAFKWELQKMQVSLENDQNSLFLFPQFNQIILVEPK